MLHLGRLNKHLWCNHGISIATKVAVYRAMILTSLLYGCEGWTLYRHHIQQLDQFHMRCLRKIAHIKWQDHIPNTTVLTICNISGIEAFLQTAQLRWCGHVIRMQDSRIPKQVFYGQLHHGSRRPGGQYIRYKDHLKAMLNQRGITPSHLETLVSDRADWRSTCKSAVQEFESRRIRELETKRDLRKSGPPTTSNFQCQICHRMCRSNIGLTAHVKSHSRWWDPSHRRLSPYIHYITWHGSFRSQLCQIQWQKSTPWSLGFGNIWFMGDDMHYLCSIWASC